MNNKISMSLLAFNLFGLKNKLITVSSFVFIQSVWLFMALINMSNIPGEQICGLDSETLEFVTYESNYRFLSELDPSFFDDLPIPDLTIEEEKNYEK